MFNYDARHWQSKFKELIHCVSGTLLHLGSWHMVLFFIHLVMRQFYRLPVFFWSTLVWSFLAVRKTLCRGGAWQASGTETPEGLHGPFDIGLLLK